MSGLQEAENAELKRRVTLVAAHAGNNANYDTTSWYNNIHLKSF